jgi:capsule polysaccharide export protein KpsE/RkpR
VVTKRGHGVIGGIAHHPWVAGSTRRRVCVAVAAAALAVLSVWPVPHRAAVTLTPVDPSTLGVNPASNSGGLGALAMLGGGGSMSTQQLIESSLQVSRSVYVRKLVATRLNLPARLGKSEQATLRWLEHEVDARSLRGGIIEVDTKQHDADLALELAGAYADAIREQMGIVNRTQNSLRQKALEQVLDQAGDRLSKAQAAYDTYRLKTGSGDPLTNALQVAGRAPALDDMIAAKQAEIAGLRRFATDGNFRMQKAQAELAGLQARAAQARSGTSEANGSVGRVVAQTSQGLALRRELELSTMMYEAAKRNLQGTLAESLVSTVNIRVLEQPYLDPDRQYNYWAVALLALVLGLGVAVEVYRAKPPLSAGKMEA